ncbi:MAG: hypothetical protein ACLFQ6_04655 [Candidatus Sumerlaeia bacterium]
MGKSWVVLEKGWECAAGCDRTGWYMASIKRTGSDDDFLQDKELPGERFALQADKSLDEWMEVRPGGIGRSVVLVREASADKPEILCEADRLYGPAIPREETDDPVVCWTAKTDGKWRFQLFAENSTKILKESDKILLAPAVAFCGSQLFCACEIDEADGRFVLLMDATGKVLQRLEGMHPKLVAMGERLALIVEGWNAEDDCYELRLHLIEPSGKGRKLAIPPADDMNLHADMAWNSQSGLLWIAHEASPRWGFNEFIGGHRSLFAWVYDTEQDEIRPAPGTSRGNLAIPREAFCDYVYPGGMKRRDTNMPPLQPRLLPTPDGMIVSWLWFRFRGTKTFGWDVWGMRQTAGNWSEPVRLSPSIGLPDTGYALVWTKDKALCFQPCIDQEAGRSLESELGPSPRMSAPHRLLNPRVELFEADPDKGLEAPLFPENRRGLYMQFPPTDHPGANPEALESAPDDLQLIWGDIHAHSAYSKCMSANDGSPEEVIRFQRDVLGCKVLALTEHLPMMSESECTWHWDMLEAEAGKECVPIYGCEPGIVPGHHTNFYSIDREVMERLRAIVMTVRSRDLIYREIKKHFPAGSVYAFRHYHGNTYWKPSVLDPETVDTHDPELELCMESMQCRGNAMMGQGIQQDKHPRFPTNFLNCGAKMGLVAGTDHCGGVGPNHFGLTGFWVPEISPEAVWNCLRERRTIACSNGKLAIWATMQGKPMGEIMKVGDAVEVEVELASARTIRRVCLLRNGEPVEWQDVNARSARLQLCAPFFSPDPEWYSVTAEGEGTLQDVQLLAHASPFFVSH